MDDRAAPLDAETKVAERPHDHKNELRLWLRLFTCKELIESEVRKHLRVDFQLTLPPGGMRREGRVDFTIGDGRAKVTAQTFSGSIIINSGSTTRRDDE